MGVVSKIIKRAKLSDAAGRVLSPFASSQRPLPEFSDAMEALSKIRPDCGSSCLWNRGIESQTDEYDIAVIVPVYNAGDYLRSCLDSVLTQKTRFSFRVIAVDDGSTDDSAAVLASFTDSRLIVAAQENRGAAAARNAGLRLCRARYVLFLDADDVLLPDCLETLVAFSDEHHADILQTAYRVIDESGNVRQTVSIPGLEGYGGVIDPVAQCTGFIGDGKLFRAELFDHICFPESYSFEDSVLAQILLPLAERDRLAVFGLNFPSVGYRTHPGSTTNRSKTSPKSVDSLWITLSLYRDRQSLGLVSDQAYYEYLLNMQSLTWRRVERLGDAVLIEVFTVFRDFLLGNFPTFRSARPAFRMLEDALRDGDFGKYRLFCMLH